MKPAGSIYKTEKAKYVAVYRPHRDIHVMLPPNLAKERVGHISYAKGSKEGGIDIFPISSEDKLQEFINIKKELATTEIKTEINGISLTNAIINNQVKGEISSKYDFEHLKTLSLVDILIYSKGKPAKNEVETGINLVDNLSAKTELKKINVEKWLAGGKSEFVEGCMLEANIDFVDDCFARFLPGKEPSFDGEFFNNYFHLVGGECNYCYADIKHKTFAKTIKSFDKDKILDELQGNCNLVTGSKETLGRPVKILRFGKRTEAWTPFTQEHFTGTLELMTQTKTKGVIPTKFLPFDKQVSDLVKKTNSTLLYSIGEDDWELGAVAHGATNEFRIEQAIKYKEDGANSMLYLLLPTPYLPPQEKEKKILEIADKNGIQVQVLPMRYKSKNVANKVTNNSWLELKTDNLRLDIFSSQNSGGGSYIHMNGSGLVPTKYHPEWLNLIGKNKGLVKMCHHDPSTVYCGSCSYKPGFIKEHKYISPTKLIKNSKPKTSNKYSGMNPLF